MAEHIDPAPDTLRLPFRIHSERYAVCRLRPDQPAPAWAMQGRFWSVTRAPEELSIVCLEPAVPDGVRAQKDWACLQLIGPFEFALTGILSAFIGPLAAARVPIFALSTFDTDWVLVPAVQLDDALCVLASAGHRLQAG